MSQLPSRSVLSTGAVLGLVLGFFLVGGVYVTVEHLPPTFGILIPLGSFGVLLLAFWPSRFDADRGASLFHKFGQRVITVVVAGVVAGVVAAAAIVVFPGYVDWADAQHRAHLVRQQTPEAEIVARLADHRLTLDHQFRDGIIFSAIPGTVASVITTVAAAVSLRRRR